MTYQERWQPIQSAPRDGTEILILGSGIVSVAKWWQSDRLWHQFGVGAIHDPEYWMPLPVSPRSPKSRYEAREAMCGERQDDAGNTQYDFVTVPDPLDWRKGVEFIASCLGDEGENLSCVRLGEMALAILVCLEELNEATEQYLEEPSVERMNRLTEALRASRKYLKSPGDCDR